MSGYWVTIGPSYLSDSVQMRRGINLSTRQSNTQTKIGKVAEVRLSYKLLLGLLKKAKLKCSNKKQKHGQQLSLIQRTRHVYHTHCMDKGPMFRQTYFIIPTTAIMCTV